MVRLLSSFQLFISDLAKRIKNPIIIIETKIALMLNTLNWSIPLALTTFKFQEWSDSLKILAVNFSEVIE